MGKKQGLNLKKNLAVTYERNLNKICKNLHTKVISQQRKLVYDSGINNGMLFYNKERLKI